jgi:Calcineurin-like phosphoesterase
MIQRTIKNYVSLPRNPWQNKKFSRLSDPIPSKIKYKIEDFFSTFFGVWFYKDIIASALTNRHPYEIKEQGKSIYSLRKAANKNDKDPITIALTADWATDTPQSSSIGKLIAEKDPDYTLHLGDTYYCGNEDEINDNFRQDLWPYGRVGSFALLGNHEMFSGANAYYDLISQRMGAIDDSGKFISQNNPFFCLRTDHWCILGLDTGYQSINASIWEKYENTNLSMENGLIDWLNFNVNLGNEKRGLIILTHHQYITAFKDEKKFQNPAMQLKKYFTDEREVIWIWGHEHRFAMYGKYKNPDDSKGNKYITAYGRCIGNGGMPVEIAPIVEDDASTYHLRLYDNRIQQSFSFSINQKDHLGGVKLAANGYALMEIKGSNLTITYYASYVNDEGQPILAEQPLIAETWCADNTNGGIKFLGAKDFTKKDGSASALTYFGGDQDPMSIGK